MLPQSKAPLRILFLAAEADPFVKIGGLGDVAGSLPAALRSFPIPSSDDPAGKNVPGFTGVDIRLVIPFHGAIQRQNYPLQRVASFTLSYEGGLARAEALLLEMHGLPVYLVAGALIPPDAPVYTSDASLDGVKFTFFSLAALELARTLDWTPHLVHANDWHTAPALWALALDREPGSFYYNTATLLGLHNLPYLGVGAGPALAKFGLPPARASVLPAWAQDLPLPLGLLGADAIVAASPSYAQEILTPEFGSGLHEFLRSRQDSIFGILNGIDSQRWDPATDPALPACYDRNHLEARRANKLALQSEFGLEPGPQVPLLALISRLDPQKGVDLLPQALASLSAQPWQAILLGAGDPALEAALRRLETSFPDRVRAAIRFDSALSRRLYGGADALLIPSRYEPCGLTQMIAMRYGCVPIARAVGGLKDTIQDYSRTTDSTGFLFTAANSQALAAAISRTLQVYAEPEAWQGMQQRGMQCDFSWEGPARQYLALYSQLVEARQAQLLAGPGSPIPS